MKRIIVLWFSLMLCLLFVACSEDSTDIVEVPVSASAYRGENYQDVVNELSVTGFANIQTEAIEDLVTGWLTKDGEVEEVSIDGNSTFREGDKFDRNVEIRITYHTFPRKDENHSNDLTESPDESTTTGNYRTETEKWLASSEYADCLEDGKFPVVPGNNPYGSGINESIRNQNIYYLNSSRQGPWGKASEYGDYYYYIPSGKYLVMNASNPKQYAHVATACNVYVCNPENDEEWDTYYFAEYGEIQEIVIPDGYYVALTISAIITLEPLSE